MSRQIIIYTAAGARTYRNIRINPSKEALIILGDGEARTVDIDLTSMLDAGETVDSATLLTQGMTATIALTTPIATVTIATAKCNATATATLTLSSGEVHIQKFRTAANDGQMRDYL